MFQSSISVGVGYAAPEQRGSIENPNTPLSGIDDSWDDAFGITRSESGVRISRRTANTIAAWFRGVNVISRYVAKTPLFVIKRLQPKGKERDHTHFAYRLVRRKFNPQMTAFVAKQTITAHAVAEGNGYGYIKRRGNGEGMEVWPLLPDRTWPVRINGKLWYVTEVEQRADPTSDQAESEDSFIRRRRKLRAEDVIHIKGLGYDGLVGYNVIKFAAQSLGLAIAGRDYGSKFFRNNASGRVVLEAPNTIDDNAAKRMLGGWRKMTEGLNNAHKTAILEQGTKANVLSASAKDAQLIELMQWGDKQVANWLNLPEHMIGGEGRTSYASLEQENQRFLDDALDPWFCVWEGECWDKLLTEEQKESESHDFEFLREALIRTNFAQRQAGLNIMHQNGAINRDEWRDFMGMNPLPGGQGQIYMVPLNMQPAADLGKQGLEDGDSGLGKEDAEKPKPKEDEDRSRLLAATRAAVRDAADRMQTRLEKSFDGQDFENYEAFRAAFARHDKVMRLALRPSLEAALIVRGDQRDAAAVTEQFSRAISERLRAEILAGASETDLDALPDSIVDAFLSPNPES
jgi:HK97 family phage portal protein